MVRILLLSGFLATLWAGVPAEVSALDSVTGGSGTHLVSMPTYVYDRPAGSAGLQAEDELWNPHKASRRHLPNRYSEILNWNTDRPGIWFYTGNEVGDLLYQELLQDSHGANRTPMMDGGVRTPAWNGVWVTGQGSQVDHFSSATLSERTRRDGDMSFAWFGENLPAFSTAFAGGGYERGLGSASVLAGSDYLWVLTRSRRWVPVRISPRVQGDAAYGRASLHVAYERQDFADQVLQTTGTKQEVSGSLRYACPTLCAAPGVRLGAGLAFRHENDSGAVPWGLRGSSTLAWPWLETSVRGGKWFRWEGHAGMNDRDWLVRDSLEMEKRQGAFTLRGGWLNQLGTALDPMAYDFEAYNNDTLDLLPRDGYLHLEKLYAHLSYTRAAFVWGLSGWSWLAKGAETFALADTFVENDETLRRGNVERIQEWLGGSGTSALVHWNYDDWFRAGAEGGWEYFYGPLKQAEVEPAQAFAKLMASWILLGTLSLDHEWMYRSAAQWNQEVSTLRVPAGWSWNASLVQRFPRYKTSLQATWLHVLPSDAVQAPRGGFDRTRFYCGVRKEF